MLGYVDFLLGVAFFYFVHSRPSYAVWIARYFVFRLGWYSIFCLIASDVYQYFRRTSLAKTLGCVSIWFLGLTILATLQLLLLRIGDQLIMAQHCGAYDASSPRLHDFVAAKMDPITQSMAQQLNPTSRQLNASYCNIDLARHALYSSKTISSMENEQTTAETRSYLQGSMRNRCSQSIASPSKGQKNTADIQGYDLTQLALSITTAQWVFVRPGGPLATSRKVGLANRDLYAALNSLSTKPSFWDDARILPPTNTNRFSVNYVYKTCVRPLLSHEFYPYSLDFVSFILTKQHTNQKYHLARTSLDKLMKATAEYSEQVKWAYTQRCSCLEASPDKDDDMAVDGFNECNLQSDMEDYVSRYISNDYSVLTIDRAPLEKILELRRNKAPCEGWGKAVELMMENDDVGNRMWKDWQSDHCATLGPLGSLGRMVPDQWVGWWDHLGTRWEGVRNGDV
ncbi:hypothetical protein AC578_4346 [Pseudocercospora eumusae]|uniref:Uncharacterized protein n=1 Tax=Pseudocercospora eumusae TaxID=321146 RepID=A0A139H5T3_9PEZI|nr:hypothetical protein AC578_4346 [Pseudocercospora eumusae]